MYFDCFDCWEHSEPSPAKTIYQEVSFLVLECLAMETKATPQNTINQNTIGQNTIDQKN